MELVTVHGLGVVDTESGVKVGQYTFRSFPLPGQAGTALRHVRLSLGPAGPDITPLVYARNAAGTEATATFWFKLFPKKFRVRDFRDRRRADGQGW